MPLITATDLATYLGLSDDEADAGRLDPFADGASAYLVRATGRDWQQVPRTESVRGTDTPYLVVRHHPIVALTSVTERGVALRVDPGDGSGDVAIANAHAGILVKVRGGPWACDPYPSIALAYKGGVPAPPHDLVMAALDLAAYVYQTTGGRASASQAGAHVTFVTLGARGVASLPSVRAALDLHADPVYAAA